jgi:hypothetical protein
MSVIFQGNTIILRGKKPINAPRNANPDNLQSKLSGGKNSQTVNMNAKKLEERIDNGETTEPPKIPREISQKIQSGRIAKGFKTQKSFYPTVKEPQITQIELQQMENGSFLLTPANRPKVQAVGRALGLGPLNLPKM